MESTHGSLLERLRQPGEPLAWQRFVQLYTPLLISWSRRLRLQDADAADLVQDVLMHLVRKLPEFDYQPGKSFRGWLHTVLVNKWRDRSPSPAAGGKLPEVGRPDPQVQLTEAEYQQHLVGRALQLMKAEFPDITWKAFWEYFACGRPAAQVAQELKTTVNVVYLARSRVMTRLRQELGGLLD